MNRLQVGGLALIIKAGINDSNVGKVVKLIEYSGAIGKYDSTWLVGGELVNELGDVIDEANISQCRLMPLGDKQGQDEIMKEKELEYLK